MPIIYAKNTKQTLESQCSCSSNGTKRACGRTSKFSATSMSLMSYLVRITIRRGTHRATPTSGVFRVLKTPANIIKQFHVSMSPHSSKARLLTPLSPPHAGRGAQAGALATLAIYRRHDIEMPKQAQHPLSQ
eukprot:856591-Pyramimonas_sp.AAC.1